MAPIAPENIYTKTAKGILEVKNKSVRLPRELGLVFLSIDGKASIAELLPRSGMTAPQFHHAIGTLVSDGYIKVVSTTPREAPAAHDDEVDFTPSQVITALNMEAASHALAAAEAAKRAQAEARAALDARMRVESEARARALAEARADSEAQARLAAEEAARSAANERIQAELEASTAADAQERAQAETRARAAAAAAVRADAEARVRAEAFARAKAEAETKRIAEEEALREAEARVRNEEQAQARAAAEERAREALEAQMQALDSVRAGADDAQGHDAEAARARARELEEAAVEARAAAREIAEAEGRADEVAQPEMDIADRVRQLNARVNAERRAREEAARKPRGIPQESMTAAAREGEWPSLQLTDAAPPAQPDVLDIAIEPPPDGVREAAAAPAADSEFPAVDLNRAEPPPRTPEHEPTALERAMAQLARAKAQQRDDAAPANLEAPETSAPEPLQQSTFEDTDASTEEDAAPAEKLVPTLDDDEPLHERLNIDRAAHDIMAEEAEARRKAETAQYTRDAIDARRRRADEAARKATLARRREQRRKVLTAAAVALLVAPVLGALWLQFSTLDGYIPEARRALAERFNQPVTISTLRYPLLPTPRLILENVNIGEGSVQAERIEARVLPLALLAGPSSFDLVDVQGAAIDQRALGAIPGWTGGRTAGSIHTDRLRVTELKLALAGATLAPVNGEVEFAPNGTVRRAAFSNENVKILLTPQSDGARIELTASDWRVPYGPPFEWSHLQLRGLIDQSQVAAAEFTGRVAGGNVEGALNARWGNAIDIRGEFSAAGVRLQELARAFGSELSANGTLKTTGRFAMQAPEWPALTANAQVNAAFTGSRGEIINIDLLRAVQSPTPGAMRGGRTPFEAFTGTLQVAGGRYVLQQLKLAAGPLGANGFIEVTEGRLDGRITAELLTRGTRSTLLLGGTLKDPQLRR